MKKFGQVMEAAKKVLFLVAGPLREGEGLNGCATKDIFYARKNVPMATKPRRGGGAKGLSGGATKKRTFFAASLMEGEIQLSIMSI